jgi:hypothetical protein
VAETSLSLLKEENLERLRHNGFAFIAPGIESWYEMGNKSKLRSVSGMEKVRRVAEHANLVNEYIPYTQCNLIFGLDVDEGDEPFELTKQFIDQAPGIYPHYSLLSAFGRNAALNLGYQRENRIVPVPFEFLDLVEAMNVIPKNYTWSEFYRRVVDVHAYSFSPRAMARRLWQNRRSYVALEQVFRSSTSDRFNRLGYHRKMRRWIESDSEMNAFFHGRTRRIPGRLLARIRHHLGPLWEWLPDGALSYDPNAYLNSSAHQSLPVLSVAT